MSMEAARNCLQCLGHFHRRYQLAGNIPVDEDLTATYLSRASIRPSPVVYSPEYDQQLILADVCSTRPVLHHASEIFASANLQVQVVTGLCPSFLVQVPTEPDKHACQLRKTTMTSIPEDDDGPACIFALPHEQATIRYFLRHYFSCFEIHERRGFLNLDHPF